MTHDDTMLIIGCAVVGFGLVWMYFPSPASPQTDEHAHDDGRDGQASQREQDRANGYERKTEEFSGQNDKPRNDSAPHNPHPSWCDILLVERHAGQAEIRRAFARVMKSIHPDTATHDAETSARCLKVKHAYEQAKLDAQNNGRP